MDKNTKFHRNELLNLNLFETLCWIFSFFKLYIRLGAGAVRMWKSPGSPLCLVCCWCWERRCEAAPATPSNWVIRGRNRLSRIPSLLTRAGRKISGRNIVWRSVRSNVTLLATRERLSGHNTTQHGPVLCCLHSPPVVNTGHWAPSIILSHFLKQYLPYIFSTYFMVVRVLLYFPIFINYIIYIGWRLLRNKTDCSKET